MDRISLILSNPKYIEYCNRIYELEINRFYCKHNLEHFLSVARIAHIMNLENKLSIDTELIYAAALLHDIGRWVQYENKTPHNEASAEIAPKMLTSAGFQQSEIEQITSAILTHRNCKLGQHTLNYIIYHADKKSRLCFACNAESICDWSNEKKNRGIYL